MLIGCRLPEVRETRAEKDELREPGDDQAKERCSVGKATGTSR
jgi:hypothetical protein